MKLYFSGVSGHKEFDYLTEAKVDHILVDPYDLKHISPDYKGHLALDSGAYRAFKSGKPIMFVEDYYRLVDSRPFDFAIMQDTIGDAESTLRSWNKFFSPKSTMYKHHPKFVPVYQWHAPRDHLLQYLDESELVAIGGLVPLMRAKDRAMFYGLTSLVNEFPGRFHILGMNWLNCIEYMKDFVKSCDTSKFLDAGRYGHVIFRHSKTGHLQQVHARILKLGHYTREQRIFESITALKDYTQEVA
jgi:hypothetical protein